MSEPTTPEIKTFFDQYIVRMNRALATSPKIDIDGMLSAFFDFFIEATPKEVRYQKNDEQLRTQLRDSVDFYRKIGTKSMNIRELETIMLDSVHSIVKVRWSAFYMKKEGETLTLYFNVTYLLRVVEGVIKIFGYIAGDEQKLYKENGLLPESNENK